MGPPGIPTHHCENQGTGRRRRPTYRPRMRRCLLKDCEQRFHPRQARQRYCSEHCREEAQRRSRWKAQQRYRETAAGEAKRNGQSRRYSEIEALTGVRLPLVSSAAEPQVANAPRRGWRPTDQHGTDPLRSKTAETCAKLSCSLLWPPIQSFDSVAIRTGAGQAHPNHLGSRQRCGAVHGCVGQVIQRLLRRAT